MIVLSVATLLAVAVPFFLKFVSVQAADCQGRNDVPWRCVVVQGPGYMGSRVGVLLPIFGIVAIGGALALEWGLPRARVAAIAISSVLVSCAIAAVIGMAILPHAKNAPSGESPPAAAGMGVDQFCPELRNLWDGGVLQAIRDVDNAGRAGATPTTSVSDLHIAATNAQKLADDAPLGESGGGGDLKTELTSVAHILSAAAAGQPAHTVFDGQGVVEWQEIHCP